MDVKLIFRNDLEKGSEKNECIFFELWKWLGFFKYWLCGFFNTGERSEPEKFDYKKVKIVAAFQGMHVSPAKHSYVWLPRKCDYRTDRQTDGQTDRHRTKWSLCAAMLRRWHKNKLWTHSPTHQTFTLDPTSDKSQGGGGSKPTTYASDGSPCPIL